MGIYRRQSTTYDDTHEWTQTEVYRYPLWRHLLLSSVTRLTRHTGPLERRLDPWLEKLHDLRCHDDCWTGEVSRIKPYWLTPEGKEERHAMKEWSTPQTHPEMWHTETTTMCNRTPLSAEIDMWVHYFGQRDLEHIETIDGPKRLRPDGERDGQGPKITFSEHVQQRMKNL